MSKLRKSLKILGVAVFSLVLTPMISMARIPSEYEIINGTPVYFNPNTGKLCLKKDVNPDTTAKNGCMKWYTFGGENDSKDGDVNLLLDHNTKVSGEMGSAVGLSGLDGAYLDLKEDTKDWHSSVKSSVRFITADEIASIVGADQTIKWSSTKPYVDATKDTDIESNISSILLGYNSTGKYITDDNNGYQQSVRESFSWLADNTYIEDGYPMCYITSTLVNTNESESVFGVCGPSRNLGSALLSLSLSNSVGFIRPVITIPKSIIFKGVSFTKSDESTGIEINSSTTKTDYDVSLSVNSVDEESEIFTGIKTNIVETLKIKVNKIKIFDINIMKDGNKVQPNSSVIISVPIPEGYDSKKILVYREEEDGTLTKLNYSINDGKIEFETEHFSNYIIVESEENIEEITDNTEQKNDSIEAGSKEEVKNTEDKAVENPKTGLGIKFGMLIFIIIVGVGSYIYMKKYNKFPKMK